MGVQMRAAGDVAALLGDLVGVGEVETGRGAQCVVSERTLSPGADEGAVDGDGIVDAGLADVGVVEEVVGSGFEGVDVQGPSLCRGW